MQKITKKIEALKSIKKYPDQLWYKGDLSLLDRPKVSIVGSRQTSQYTREYTHHIASSLARIGVVVVSGAAMGVDAVAHLGAGASNTIAVLPSGIDVRYPATNREMIEQIEQNGLTISQFEPGFMATNWSFVLRNEIVVALGDVLVVTQAELDSGSIRSVEFAQKMGKDIYVLPHMIGQSSGTNDLLARGKAKAIYDVDEFVSMFGAIPSSDIPKDDFYYFCQKTPTLDEAVSVFGDRVYEAELEGLVRIENGVVRLA